jgi:uncharacterized protein (DUF885 family)
VSNFGRTVAVVLLLAGACPLPAQSLPYQVSPEALEDAGSELRSAILRYDSDRDALRRTLPVNRELSPTTRKYLSALNEQWLKHLERRDFDALSLDGKIDFVLFENLLRREQHELELADRRSQDVASLVPFRDDVVVLIESTSNGKGIDPRKASDTLDVVTRRVQEVRRQWTKDKPSLKRPVVFRAAGQVDALGRALKQWNEFHHGYHPEFTWWAGEPYKQIQQELRSYADFLRKDIAGVKEGPQQAIVGDPLGRDALLEELAFEFIPYTPEELVEIGEREFAWCEQEMKKAAGELGHDGDWLKALEQVKNLHEPPGKQPEMIRELALYATDFVEKHDLVTVPPLARETWRMIMMSPERQLVSPFFTGGEVISVSFPTGEMPHDQKLMSLRGNNRHFSWATVHHELIPGHHLQQFMMQRHRPYRQPFGTPFWMEGWALYWEMLLWDRDFARGPEDRVGMLFWRSHRAARILFSLKFHLEEMTPQECIELLVKRVGHERANAEAEVRRSVQGDYPPLYQAAYMLGGLQIRNLRNDLVDGGTMTHRQFHDAILQENSIPIELLRAKLTNRPPQREFKSSWRFYEL